MILSELNKCSVLRPFLLLFAVVLLLAQQLEANVVLTGQNASFCRMHGFTYEGQTRTVCDAPCGGTCETSTCSVAPTLGVYNPPPTRQSIPLVMALPNDSCSYPGGTLSSGSLPINFSHNGNAIRLTGTKIPNVTAGEGSGLSLSYSRCVINSSTYPNVACPPTTTSTSTTLPGDCAAHGTGYAAAAPGTCARCSGINDADLEVINLDGSGYTRTANGCANECSVDPPCANYVNCWYKDLCSGATPTASNPAGPGSCGSAGSGSLACGLSVTYAACNEVRANGEVVRACAFVPISYSGGNVDADFFAGVSLPSAAACGGGTPPEPEPPTPVHCVGSWGSCSDITGVETYTVTTSAENGGNACPATHGQTRNCRQNCVGSWSICSGGNQTYSVTTPATGGGTACAANHGASQSCANCSIDITCQQSVCANPGGYVVSSRTAAIGYGMNDSCPAVGAPYPSAGTCVTAACSGGGPGGGGCFVAGTRIRMADGGLKNIETIVEGDVVLSFDEISKEVISSKVERVHRHKASKQKLYEFIMADGARFVVTDIHPLYAANLDSYVRVEDMYVKFSHAEDFYLKNVDGVAVPVVSITEFEDTVPVFNFEVEGISKYSSKYGRYGLGHNYFAEDYLAHNAIYIKQVIKFLVFDWLGRPREVRADLGNGDHTVIKH